MKRILVALDGSERAASVLAAAARLADLARATLVLFRAIHVPIDLPRNAIAPADVRLEDVLLRSAHAELAALAADLPSSIVEAIVTEMAAPWDGIVRAARQHDADLVVIGSHGYGGLDRVLGTTAGKVVNHADRNVLVVRTPL